MQALKYVLFFASTAVAQSAIAVMLLNPIWSKLDTLTFERSDASATTYAAHCPTKTTTYQYTTTKPWPRASDDPARSDVCIPITLIQGSHTYRFDATHTVPGVLTRKGECTWEGEVTVASLTCTGLLEGSAYQTSISGTTTFGQEELVNSTFWDVAMVVGMPSITSAGTTTTNPAEPTGVASDQSKGPAPSPSIPMGAMVFAGGAAGVLGLAMGL